MFSLYHALSLKTLYLQLQHRFVTLRTSCCHCHLNTWNPQTLKSITWMFRCHWILWLPLFRSHFCCCGKFTPFVKNIQFTSQHTLDHLVRTGHSFLLLLNFTQWMKLHTSLALNDNFALVVIQCTICSSHFAAS
jgi:hypothetical protein